MIKSQIAERIIISDENLNWQESIQLASQQLIDEGAISPQYVEDMILNVEKNGSYIVLVPYIALPHARSNGNVFKTSISCLKLTNPVMFPDEQPVSVFFVLATNDDSHLDILGDFADVLSEKEKVEQLKEAKTKQDILAVFN
ncbi:PTS sugar transporter subunit IIA [Orbus mooreae]|uniref:PTS sugar transporter subunit IIA n=1 Tax=Orbus mooreae TaxID=3074107 RepID=UPI00370DCFCB